MTVSKYKVGDSVFFPTHGYGTVTHSGNVTNSLYPIYVTWDTSANGQEVSTFTKDGFLMYYHREDAPQLTVVEKNEEKKEKKSMEEDKKFKVGDHVWSFHFGVGIITRVDTEETNTPYPVTVYWTDDSITPNTYEYYTRDGKFDITGMGDPDKDITPFEVIDWSEKEDTGVVERMEDALYKKTEDAINPSHYKVKGLPEAHEIINHLMHREQYEGFLWGNIIKYAYRYGRKGDKAETSGKIAWYATKLKKLEECESK